MRETCFSTQTHNFILYSCRSTGVPIRQVVIGANVNRSPGSVPRDYAKITDNFCTIQLKGDNSVEMFDVPLAAKIDGKKDGTQMRMMFLDISISGERTSRQNLAYIPVRNHAFYRSLKVNRCHFYILRKVLETYISSVIVSFQMGLDLNLHNIPSPEVLIKSIGACFLMNGCPSWRCCSPFSPCSFQYGSLASR